MKKDPHETITDLTVALQLITTLYKAGYLNSGTYQRIQKKYQSSDQ